MNMEKKLYVTPSLEVVEMECVSILAGSPPKVDVPIEDKEDFNEEPIGTKKLEGNFNHDWK